MTSQILLSVVAFVVLFASPSAAQACVAPTTTDAVSEAEPEPALKTVVEPTKRLTSRIVLVVDVSGSMKGRRIEQALAAVHEVMNQPLDDLEIALIVFSEGMRRWPGYRGPEDKDLPDGWGRLPSADTLREAQQWLGAQPSSGGTDPRAALASAVNDPRDDLSVILITDGDFNEHSQLVVGLVQGAQKARGSIGLAPAVVMVYGVGESAGKMPWMVGLAEDGGGGLFVER